MLLTRRAQLQEELKRKRLKDEIQAMEDEAAGREPTQYAEVAGTTLPTRKRPRGASSTASDPDELHKIIKITKPKSFNGKTIKELRNFDSS